jgi:kynureninase
MLFFIRFFHVACFDIVCSDAVCFGFVCFEYRACVRTFRFAIFSPPPFLPESAHHQSIHHQSFLTMTFANTLDFARACDAHDPLQHFRSRFVFPQHTTPDARRDAVYFTGNSLGLIAASVRQNVVRELDRWERLGVEGHFERETGTPHEHEVPWVEYHRQFEQPLARIVGAKPHEVVAMNALTVNLHLLLASLYRPSRPSNQSSNQPSRFKVICEAGAFPSDQYALETHLRWHGINPDEAIIEVAPRTGEHTLRTEDILSTIAEHADSLALVMFSGVQYYTGQVFAMEAIAAAARKAGAVVGFDLAHAVGNVPLALHDWGVDFAVWCSYKYLNSSPGGIAGAFIHERHATNVDAIRLAGWWGNDESERFQMRKGFRPAHGAQSWQASNTCILGMAAHKAALDIFDETSIAALRRKSLDLTGFLEFVIDEASRGEASHDGVHLEIITPRNPDERGCQLSLLVHHRGKDVFEHLTRRGVIVDWREPNVIRAAPTPLYNSFEDVWRFGEALREALR